MGEKIIYKKKGKAAGEDHWIVIVFVNMDMDDNL